MNDEITPIAIFMAHEINSNAHGPDARKISELNCNSTEQCIEEYRNLPLWRQLLGLGISPQQCVSNEMTYSHAALLSWGLMVRQDGQWDHKTVIPARFHRSGVVDGLRAFDDPADRAAVTEGIRLYRAGPRHVTAQKLVSFVTTSTEITQKPYQL